VLALWVAQWGLLIVGVLALAVVLTAGTETHHDGDAQPRDDNDSVVGEPTGVASAGPSRIG
jgi:hypothetical protein